MNIQSNAEETDKQKSRLIEYEQVKETPFTIAKILRENEEKHDYYIMMGKYRISEKYEEHKEVMKDAERIDWWKIMGVIHAIANEVIDRKNTEKIIKNKK